MALTKKIKDTIQERAQRNPEFREGLLSESIGYFYQEIYQQEKHCYEITLTQQLDLKN